MLTPWKYISCTFDQSSICCYTVGACSTVGPDWKKVSDSCQAAIVTASLLNEVLMHYVVHIHMLHKNTSLKLAITNIFSVSGTEELRSVHGLIARAVCPTSTCMDLCPVESLWCVATVLSISLAPSHLPTLHLLAGRVELRWWSSVPWLLYRYRKSLLFPLLSVQTNRHHCQVSHINNYKQH